MVCHTDASRINVERMRQIYSRLLGYKGHKGELIGKLCLLPGNNI